MPHPCWIFLLLGLLLALATSLLVGCQRCSAGPPLARLLDKSGQVERDFSRKQEAWQVAEVGAEFSVGDAVKTEQRATARLGLDDGSLVEMEQGTVIRFLDKEPGAIEQALDLEMGSASLSAPEGAVLRTAFGLARLEKGSRVQLSRAGVSLRYEVLVGSAVVENAAGGVMKVTEGQLVETVLGQALLELIEAPPETQLVAPEEEVPLGEGDILAKVVGGGVRHKPPGTENSVPLGAGDRTIAAGTVVEVGAGSSVALARGHERAVLDGGGTYVVGADGHLVSARSGAFTVSSSDAVRIKVPGGVIVTRGGSAKITAEGRQGTRVQVSAGSVTLRGKAVAELSSGEEGRIATDGTVSVKGRGAGASDVDVISGQSLVIHDPRPPTRVGFLFGDHCEVGVVRLSGKASAIPGDDFGRGDGHVSLGIGPGSVAYALHCVGADGGEGEVKSQGKITVLADAGTRSVPKTAPSTFVDVNGRNYNVLYQNQLPQVTVRWSGAPEGVTSFSVKRSSPGHSRTYRSSSPTYTFGSGMLSEGTHQIYFEGGGRVSRRSSITIRFDNATPTASLQTPAQSGVGPGGSLPVVGTALPGWSVTVDGKPVGQDADGRFSVSTTMPSDGRPTTVRLTHPTRGSHVYLRRPAGAP